MLTLNKLKYAYNVFFLNLCTLHYLNQGTKK